jgi:hypothetical protein
MISNSSDQAKFYLTDKVVGQEIIKTMINCLDFFFNYSGYSDGEMTGY